jgi:hypothetical protein
MALRIHIALISRDMNIAVVGITVGHVLIADAYIMQEEACPRCSSHVLLSIDLFDAGGDTS